MKTVRPKRTRLRRGAAPKYPRLSKEDLSAAQRVVGYVFKDRALLDMAMTHPSALQGGQDMSKSNQRLEFLGDRILGLVVAERLYERRPGEREGHLAPRLNALVKKSACADAARALDLGAYLILGTSEAANGGREKEAILGDMCEAVIGAIYLDGGLKPARAFIEHAWADQFSAPQTHVRDAKSRLQEWAQARRLDLPIYSVVDRRGPDHAPRFTVRVSVGEERSATGDGPSKQDAEREAATAFLEALKPGEEI
ncbi:MAG: ribonuclease III [Pseudomonadota bacterium]